MQSNIVAAVVVALLAAPAARAEAPSGAVLDLDFSRPVEGLRLRHGARVAHGALEFNDSLGMVEVPFSRQLDGITALSVGGWFFPKAAGEQWFMMRGVPEMAPGGERIFQPRGDWVNFVLGTDAHGFLLGTILGNGRLPFPHVTVNDVPLDAWSQLVVVKDESGYQHFYINGTLVHADRNATAAGVVRPFRDAAEGEPIRLTMPRGGQVGKVWVVPRALAADEVRADFEANHGRYRPALPVEPVTLREIDEHHEPGFWERRGGPLTAKSWPKHRERIRNAASAVLGPMPEKVPPLEPRVLSEEDCGRYLRRKISIQVQPGDRMPLYLLIPKALAKPVPAVVCFYGTTSGAGKDTTVGLTGRRPGSAPERNLAFALDVVEAGYVAVAPDYLRDGERIPPSGRPYDTADFYKRFPDWSIHGKDAWDTMRAIDYLETLASVDPQRIGMRRHGVRPSVRRGKVLVFSGCESHPATGSLQPVAIGAAVEVTKPSEPSRQMYRFGDAASRQAVTRVNVEQASKRPMCDRIRPGT